MHKAIAFAAMALALFAPPCLASWQSQTSAPTPPPCESNIAVVSAVKRDLITLIGTVKKETGQDFEARYHQQTSLSRLNTCLLMNSELLSCLDKAAHDPATPKSQMKQIEELQAHYTKLKSVLSHGIEQLKAASKPEEAKALIGSFDFSH